MDEASLFNAPIIKTIRERFSCRAFSGLPISPAKLQRLQETLDSLPPGPFGSCTRFRLVAATDADPAALRGLGTYGFIHGASGFVIGAVAPADKHLEDFGYQMEALILHATRLGLGTCWLGGTFTKSSFARQIDLKSGEVIPAVTAIGEYPAPQAARRGLVSGVAEANRRLSWERLFFDAQTGSALERSAARAYALPLSMVRIAPSASNKQPWRLVRDGTRWHFFLHRAPGYRADPLKRLLDLADLQRLDMGIALCHFELTARELGLAGHWEVVEPPETNQALHADYTASWVAG